MSCLNGIGIILLSNLARSLSPQIVLKPVTSPVTDEDINPETQAMVACCVWLTSPVSHPSNEMSLPCVGLNDAMPHNAAGHLNDPPMSLPTPRMEPPPPINDPSPPDEPPTSRVGSYGLPKKPIRL